MARIRSIKPEFPQSESMGNVSRGARLFFVMLWTLCDDSGRARASSRMLASLLYPYDDGQDGHELTTAADVEAWLRELEREGCVVRYVVDGAHYVQVSNWLNHQKIDRPSASKFPTFDESSRILANHREPSSEDQGRDQGSRIKEGSASESPDGDPPPSAEPKEKKPKREKRPDLTFDQWLATIPDDADIVPVDDPLWSWWETQRLPFEWRPLAWAAFEQKYTGKPKRYADWLAVFRQAVREDWLKVWRILPDGSTVLTTVGEQLRRAA